ncbi:MAG: extracellular solute-binding protein [Brevinematia bacterium]|jgi:multiple sugar transport system substrate-binding protein
MGIKKLLKIFIIFFLLTFVFTLAQEVELNTLNGPSGLDWYIKRYTEFQDKTGIKVATTVVPYGRDQNIKLMASFLAGGSAYDVFIIDCVEVPQYAEAGWVLPIDDYVTPEMKKDLLPFAADGMMYKGKWYGLPWASEWKSFLYNEKLLSKAGFTKPPKTWNEFIKISQTLQNKKIVKYASAWSWAPKECLICDYVAIAATFGAELFDKDNNPQLNTPLAKKALQFMYDMLYKYKIVNPASISWTEDDVDKAMAAGDIAMGMRWGLPLVMLNDPTQSKTVGQWRITLMPSIDGKHPYTVSGPMGWAVSAGSKHKEEAIKFIFFMADREGAKKAAIEQGVVPGWASLFKDKDVIKAIPGINDMLEQGKYVVNRPRVPWYHDFSTMFAKELNSALAGIKSVDQALEDAQKKALEIKENYERSKQGQ